MPEFAPHGGFWEHYLSSQPSDSRLPSTSETLQFQNLAGPPAGTGSLHDVMAAWQRPPPAHSAIYDLYTLDERSQSPAPAHPTTASVYVDDATRYPVLLTVTDDTTNELISRHYFSYDVSRLTAAQEPSDFFRVAMPTNPVKDSEYHYTNNGSVGLTADQATGRQFQPYDLGATLNLVAGALCLSNVSSDTHLDNMPVSDPDPTNATGGSPNDLSSLTHVVSDYSLLPSGGQCVVGLSDIGAPDLEVMSLAQASPEAAEIRRQSTADGTAVTLLPNPLAGAAAVYTNNLLPSITAYIQSNSDGTSTAVFDAGSGTYVLNGKYQQSELSSIVSALVAR